MGILDRFRSAIFASERQSAVLLEGTKYLEVRGEASYQAELESLAGPRPEHPVNVAIVAELRREPDNPHDSNAVMVLAARAVSGRKADPVLVGYVARETAEVIAPALDRLNASGLSIRVRGHINGGWDRGPDDQGHFGVRLKYNPKDLT